MHNACCLLATALDENPSLTPEQCSKTFNMYGGPLEEAFVAQMQAIAQGGQELNHPLGLDPPGEDGPGEPNSDGEAWAPTEDLPQPRHEGPIRLTSDGD